MRSRENIFSAQCQNIFSAQFHLQSPSNQNCFYSQRTQVRAKNSLGNLKGQTILQNHMFLGQQTLACNGRNITWNLLFYRLKWWYDHDVVKSCKINHEPWTISDFTVSTIDTLLTWGPVIVGGSQTVQSMWAVAMARVPGTKGIQRMIVAPQIHLKDT